MKKGLAASSKARRAVFCTAGERVPLTGLTREREVDALSLFRHGQQITKVLMARDV